MTNPSRVSFAFFYLLPSLLFCSSIFWMKNTVDLTAWSILETLTAILFLYFLSSRSEVSLPQKKFSVSFLFLILIVSFSCLWSCHFHATLMSIYKLIFIFLLLLLFMNEKELWGKGLQWSILLFTFIGTLLTLFYPKFLDQIGMNYPTLFFGFLAQGGILSLGLFFGNSKRWRFPYLLLSVLVGMALLLSKSLSPFLAWSFGILSIAFLLAKTKLKFIFLLLLTLFLISLFMHPFHQIWERKLEDPYTLERFQIWKDSTLYFCRQPILGTGLGTFRDYYPEYKSIEGLRNAPYAHNLPLQVLCELGIVGFMLLLWIGILSLKSTLYQKEKVSQWGTWAAMAAGAFLQSLFDFNLYYPPNLILFLFFVSQIQISRKFLLKDAFQRSFLFFSTLLLTFIFILPGLADSLFRKNYFNPTIHQQTAKLATMLDPFNGFYRSETGSAEDLKLAIECEPRNIWYRRKLAFLSLPNEPQIALEQYAFILNLAPNVNLFREEAKELIHRRQTNLKKIDKPS